MSKEALRAARAARDGWKARHHRIVAENRRLRGAIPIVTDGRFTADEAVKHAERWRAENPEWDAEHPA